MDFVRNLPAISILICMFAAIISSGLKGRAARLLNTIVILVVGAMSLVTFIWCIAKGDYTVYVMGMFPAPFGNELRFGVL